jgi:hypothetical protein
MGQGAAMIFGKDATLEQYNDYELDCWAVYQGRMRVKKGNDPDDLAGLLDKLSATPSGALYTLRVYDTQNVADITDKTEPAGSFNFKLYSAAMSGFGGSDMLHARLAAIEQKLESGGGKKESKKTLGDVVMGWMENPEDLATVIGAIKMLTGSGTPAAVTGFKVAHTKDTPVDTNPAPTEQDLDRLGDAIDKLGKADPQIVQHLERLARMAETDPGKFGFLVKALDSGL